MCECVFVFICVCVACVCTYVCVHMCVDMFIVFCIQSRSFLCRIFCLYNRFEQRLLHPGANTADIITQYISSIRSLKLLDPTGVIVERVCQPIKDYLRCGIFKVLISTQNDAGRCPVAQE